jgi:nitrogen fixation/metabolism regulation signal transduction histidine kinase
MGFNRFNITVILLCILIAIAGIALVEAWTNTDFKIAKLTISVLWIGLILILIRYVNKTNRSLKQFLESIKYADFVNSDAEKGKSFKELNFSFNEIIRYVRLAELEKESTHHYLRHLLDEMPTGIITYDKRDKVEIINRVGLKILEMDVLSNLAQLNNVHPDLKSEIKDLPNTKKKVISIQTENGLKSILFRHKEIIINQRKIQVISFENIRAELDLEEERAWQRIFRVLTHEIMNSIAPIRSLTASVLKLFIANDKTKRIDQLNNEDIDIAVTGLKSIDNRNKGLSSFVFDFKKLMRIPEPQTEQIEINHFIDSVFPILQELSAEKKITLTYSRSEKAVFFKIDKEQITQVLINIVKNAVEAITNESGTIEIAANNDSDQVYITVSDNACGIPKEILSEIFIPFFTTKKEGSGIGLSISRQIMRNHKGELNISSEENHGTRSELSFPMLNSLT